MYIRAAGVASALGFGLERQARGLAGEPPPPQDITFDYSGEPRRFPLHPCTDTAGAPVAACVTDALEAAGLGSGEQHRCGVFLGSTCSNLAADERAYRERLQEPGAYALDLAGGPQSLLAVLELLGQDGAAGQHLVGAVEECAWPLAAHRQRLGLPADAPLAEASYWLWLDADCERPLAQLHWLRRFDTIESLQASLPKFDDGKPLFLACGPTLTSSAIGLPAHATPLALPGDCPHARVARLLAEFCLRPEPGRLLLVEHEPEAASYLALLLERTAEAAATQRSAGVKA